MAKIDIYKINLAMGRAGMNMSDLAAKIGVTAGAIVHFRNQANIGPKTAAKIANALGVDLADILEGAPSGPVIRQKQPEETVDFTPPDHLAELWPDYLKTRKYKRAAPTLRAFRGIVRRLEELAPNDHETQRAILDRSIINGWTDVFPLPEDKRAGGPAPRRYGPQNLGMPEDIRRYAPSRFLPF